MFVWHGDVPYRGCGLCERRVPHCVVTCGSGDARAGPGARTGGCGGDLRGTWRLWGGVPPWSSPIIKTRLLGRLRLLALPAEVSWPGDGTRVGARLGDGTRVGNRLGDGDRAGRCVPRRVRRVRRADPAARGLVDALELG